MHKRSPAQRRETRAGPRRRRRREKGRTGRRQRKPKPTPEKKTKRRHCTDKRLHNKMLCPSGCKSSLTKIYRKQTVRPELPSKKRRVRQVELCQKRGCTPEKNPDKKRTAFPPTRGLKKRLQSIRPVIPEFVANYPANKARKGRVRREELCQKRRTLSGTDPVRKTDRICPCGYSEKDGSIARWST